jgi:hypothetical protein
MKPRDAHHRIVKPRHVTAQHKAVTRNATAVANYAGSTAMMIEGYGRPSSM